MQTITREVGEEPKVRLLGIGGDLRITGRVSGEFEAKAAQDVELLVEDREDWIEVTCRSDCLLYLPRGTRIEGEAVGGDVRATDLTGMFQLETVGGDLSLRGVGGASFSLIGGDLHVRGVSTDLSIQHVGGDAIVDQVSGKVGLQQVGGDLRLQETGGPVECRVGGDAYLTFRTLAGEPISVQAGGDLACRLPAEASVSVKIRAGGDKHISPELLVGKSEEAALIELGEGETQVELIAGGDLWLRAGKGQDDFGFSDIGEKISSQVISEVEAGIAKMEARMQAFDAGMGAYNSEWIGDRVRQAVARARRKADKARKRAERKWAKAEKTQQRAEEKIRRKATGVKFDLDFTEAKEEPVSEEERLAILRMLELGKISVEEAEKLLQVLEGPE